MLAAKEAKEQVAQASERCVLRVVHRACHTRRQAWGCEEALQNYECIPRVHRTDH
jgi:hypothetical protein